MKCKLSCAGFNSGSWVHFLCWYLLCKECLYVVLTEAKKDSGPDTYETLHVVPSKDEQDNIRSLMFGAVLSGSNGKVKLTWGKKLCISKSW